MKKYLLILFLACVTIIMPGCFFNVTTLGSWKNFNIDKDVKDEIGGLNKKLFKDIMTQNVAGVKQLMSKSLQNKTGKQIDTIVNTFGSFFKAKDYKILDEYYTKSLTENTHCSLQSDQGNYNDYRIEYLALNKETYASVTVSTGLPINCLVLAIYGKYDKGWKLNILQMGEYSVLDQTAPEYYNAALYQYGKRNYIDAVDLIMVASELVHPAGKSFAYTNEYQIKDTYSVILKDANEKYHLPLTLDKIKTKPRIFSISPQFVADMEPKGIYPVIKYQSSIPISDTIALKAENKDVQSAVAEIFVGVEKNKPGVFYRAYNQIPDGKTMLTHYTFLQKGKYGKSQIQ